MIFFGKFVVKDVNFVQFFIFLFNMFQSQFWVSATIDFDLARAYFANLTGNIHQFDGSFILALFRVTCFSFFVDFVWFIDGFSFLFVFGAKLTWK